MIKQLTVSTTRKKQVIELTSQVNEVLEGYRRDGGVCTIFITHTTAGLTTGEIGEGTDKDFLEVMENIVPSISFRHAHDPSHAWTHIASSITGASLTIPYKGKKLILGTWQSVLLVEFDGPRERTVVVSVNE